MKNYKALSIGPAIVAGGLGLLCAANPALAAAPAANGGPAPAAVTQVNVTRASNYLGTDVMGSDQRKLGDIVDYIFDAGDAPHLAYVLVMTGGFLDLGGDVRAVPAAALKFDGDTARIQRASGQYFALPALPADRIGFLGTRGNAERIAQQFGVPAERATPAAGSRRGGEAISLIAFSRLRNSDAYSSGGERLGYIVDAWINLNRDRAPYVEIVPTFQPFRNSYDRRYAIPLHKLDRNENFTGFTFNVTGDEMMNASFVNATPGVERAGTTDLGDQVLRVTVPAASRPQNATSSTQDTSAAASATGRTSAEQNPAASFATSSAAQRVRSALDRDGQLSRADIQVVPDGEKLVLRGSVGTDDLHDRAEDVAEEAANGVDVNNELTVTKR